jgi:rubrerythrin
MFNGSKTKDNLMRAFAGESQARNRYTFASEKAKQQKLYVLEMLFKFTANQELAHAKIFMEHLQELDGSTLNVDGGYPVETSNDILTLLNNAVHNEFQEHDIVYKSFAEVAHQEGFYTVENSFKMIADIEKSHALRFETFEKLLQTEKLFINDIKTKWVCLNCGFEIESTQAPPVCPNCHHEQGYFIRAEMTW